MADHRTFPVMDSSQSTAEFGSKRFHDKIEHHDPQQQPGSSIENSAAAATIHSSNFILPVREAKAGETVDQQKQKSRFWSKLLHSKSSHALDAVADTHVLPIRSSTESTRKSLPLDQLFLGLPNELQIQVISFLPLSDVLNLRLASRSWHSLITLNETPIVRYHLDHHIPYYAKKLYPITNANELNFHYLCGLWHRLHVAAKLAYLMSEWVTKDIFLLQSEQQRQSFAPQHERMRRRLIPLLFTVFHYFETYRKLHLEHIEKHGPQGLTLEPYTLNPIDKQIMDMYDDETLLRVHEIFPVVIWSFCRRLRPPTYVGRVERSLRGYTREKPSDEMHVAILCLGGLREVEKLWEIKGYNTRRGAVDTWYNGLTKDPSAENQTKTRRSLMSFGRKKSTGGEREHYNHDRHRSSISSLHRTRSPGGSMDGNDPSFDSNWIFHTSLSAGMPMAQLSHTQARAVLQDLPPLKEIWARTAEALILERQIVSREEDIRRNQQVLLDLIREDGLDEVNEWGYGRNIPDSVRPPAESIDDDAE
jgi:hypothetical protein